jgi:hypothetical protein
MDWLRLRRHAAVLQLAEQRAVDVEIVQRQRVSAAVQQSVTRSLQRLLAPGFALVVTQASVRDARF